MNVYEFGSGYSAVTGDHVQWQYVPYVEDDQEHDVLIDGMPPEDAGWSLLTGNTQQHGYRGSVMHPSETMSDELIRQQVLDAGGDIFCIVEVAEHYAAECGDENCGGCTDSAAVGWAVIYRPKEERFLT